MASASSIIAKANKRLDRMYSTLSGSHESLDKVEFGIGKITGNNNVGVPKLYLRGLSTEQKIQMVQLAESYLADPYSTIRGMKAMVNKGFSGFAENRNLSNDDVVALSRLFDDNRWERLKEIERTASEQVVDMVQRGVDKGMKPKEITDTITEWLQVQSTYNGSFYDFMEEKIGQ